MVVGSQEDLEVVGEAGDGAEALALVEQCRPDVLLMDVADASPGRCPGDPTDREPRSATEAPRVLVLTTFDLDEAGGSTRSRPGRAGSCSRSRAPRCSSRRSGRWPTGTQVVAAGATQAVFERYRGPGGGGSRSHGVRDGSPRGSARSSLRAARGLSNAEIAAAEFLSEATVKTHMSAHPHQARPARSGPARRLRLRARAALNRPARPEPRGASRRPRAEDADSLSRGIGSIRGRMWEWSAVPSVDWHDLNTHAATTQLQPVVIASPRSRPMARANGMVSGSRRRHRGHPPR